MPIKISFTVRRALGMLLAIILALVIQSYYGLLSIACVPLATICIVQSSVRLYFPQALIRFILLSCTVGAVALVLAFFVSAEAEHVLYAFAHDIVLGFLVGIVSILVFFPARLDDDFRIAMQEILQASKEYLAAINDFLLHKNHNIAELNEKKYMLEKLQLQDALYPEWVYASSFSPRLQKGHRHFLMSVERLVQVLYTMQYVATQAVPAESLFRLGEPVKHCVHEVERLISVIIEVLHTMKLPTLDTDLDERITNLEHAFQKEAGLPLELLQMSPDYLYLAAYIYTFRDMQFILMKLLQSLR